MGHRGDLTSRVLELQLKLLEGRRSQQELAAHFGVNGKTIRRDIEVLSRLLPVTEERDGRQVYYRFSEDQRYVQPSFTPAEIATLLLAQESIAATGLTAIASPFAAHARSLLDKVRQSLPYFVRGHLGALASVIGSATAPAKDFSPHARVLDQLTDAAVEGRRVRVRYYTLVRDAVSERDLDPYAVYFDPDGATLKVIAYDHVSRSIRPFAVDHIRHLRPTGARFTRPPDFDLRAYLADNCFNGIHGAPVTVRLRAYGTTARVFAERTFHHTQRIIERTSRTDTAAEETTAIEMRVASGRGLVRFILSWAPDVEVLSPPELRREVAEAHRRALARHADDDDNKNFSRKG
ncbi:MAG: helix-turn-helix transcriptional regulator [Pyrinomonadaceae bacterium]